MTAAAPTLLCRASRSVLPSSGEPPRWAELHIETCLACQAEAARYSQVRRGMRLLAGGSYNAPTGMVARVMESLDDPESADHRLVIMVALLAGVVAGVAGVTVVRSRSAPSA